MAEEAFARALRALKALPRPAVYSLAGVEEAAGALGLFRSRDAKWMHVVGTNGKGTVAVKLAHALQGKGHCTGLYTSPHVFSIRERIQVNGQMISKSDFVKLSERLLALHKPLSCFEAVTLMSFLHFDRCGATWGIVEAGLGGRDDATNILPHQDKIVVITSVGMDHVPALGPSLVHIARHKAGAIHKGSRVVLGPCSEQVRIEVENRAAQVGATSLICLEPTGKGLEEDNRAIALQALRLALGVWECSAADISFDLSAQPRFRLEESRAFNGKRVLMDVGHNPPALKRVGDELVLRKYDFAKGVLVMALAKDKDARGCLAGIAARGWRLVVFCDMPGANRKAWEPAELAQLCSQDFACGDVKVESDPAKALETALAIADSFVLVCGSHNLMRFVNKGVEVDPIDMNEGG